MRVGYCQGNFNSDNCAVGGFTLDYGPFGFMGEFDPDFQPWTGGGRHFSFFNQPTAAAANFHMFWSALCHLVPEGSSARAELDEVQEGFAPAVQDHIRQIWAAKLGLKAFDSDLLASLVELMHTSKADLTLFFRELSHLPENESPLQRSFAVEASPEVNDQWSTWYTAWKARLLEQHGGDLTGVAQRMLQTNPKYTWREWLVVPAYEAATEGDYSVIHELQRVLNSPYDEQTPDVEKKYYRAAPQAMRDLGGVSHYSCSS